MSTAAQKVGKPYGTDRGREGGYCLDGDNRSDRDRLKDDVADLLILSLHGILDALGLLHLH